MKLLTFLTGSLLALLLFAGCQTAKPEPPPQPGYAGQTNVDVLPRIPYKAP